MVGRDKAPGQRESEEAIKRLGQRITELDQAALLALSQNLPPSRDNSLQGFAEQTDSAAAEISERLEPLRAAAKAEAENIGHAVSKHLFCLNKEVSLLFLSFTCLHRPGACTKN